MVKIILLEIVLIILSLPATNQIQYFVHLSFNSTLLLINGISDDLQKLFQYFNDTAFVAFLKIPLAAFAQG